MKPPKNCPHCGNLFTPSAKNPRQKYCSCLCNNRAKKHPQRLKPHALCRCETCGKEFETQPSRTRRFCTYECASRFQVGTHNPNYRGGKYLIYRGTNWQRVRNRILKRDGYRCCICGYPKGKRRFIDVHHIVAYKHFGDDYIAANQPSNLITLCRTCHVKVELHGYPCPTPLDLEWGIVL